MAPLSAEARHASADEAGTPVAEGGDVRRGQRNLYFLATKRRHLATHLVAGAVVTLIMCALLADAAFPWWRIAALGVGWALVSVAQLAIVSRVHTPEDVDRSFIIINCIAQTYMATATTLTGGLKSPLVPTLAVGAMISVVYFGPHRRASSLVLYLGVLIGAMAAMPDSVLGPALPRGEHIAIAVIALAWTLFAIRNFVARISDASVTAACAIDELREDRLADAEAQARRLQSVGAKVAHELKNPLAAIKGLVQLVARTPEAGSSKERLAVVEAEIDRMEAILREYLSFARPLEDLRKESIDLADIATDAASVLSARIEQGRLTVDLDAGPARLLGDPRRLKEALINLLANAIEATPPGGRIRLTTRATPGGGGEVELRDTGRGIRPDDLARLGTSFFTTRAHGTGLGVVLAHGVVAQHGGHMHVASSPARGTRVTITLPDSAPPATGAALTTTPDLPADEPVEAAS
jgi:signal transduction histidine kinase